MFKSLLKFAALGLGGLIALCPAVYLVFSLDRGATHPELHSADLPPLIPARAFFADPQAEFGYQPSFDGALVSYESTGLSGRVIKVREVAGGRVIAKFPARAAGLRWHPDKPLLRFLLDGQEWEADPYHPVRENWRRTAHMHLQPGWHKPFLPRNGEERVPVIGRLHARSGPNLYLVTQVGAEIERIAEGDENLLGWWLDEAFQPLLRFEGIDATRHRMLRLEDSEWREVFVCTVNDILHPVSHRVEEGQLLFLSNRGRDTVALVRMDIATGEEAVLHQRAGRDAQFVYSLGRDGVPDVVTFGTGLPERVALTERGRAYLSILRQFPAPVDVAAISSSADGRFLAAALSPQEDSFVYVLMDLQEGSWARLGDYHFRRFREHLSETEAIRFKARDGPEIPALLTLPCGGSGALPFVVMVHGGPFGADSWGYDHFKQFLANRGYGVLSVNFRGSAGFGRAFQQAGFRQFGRAMQDDVADAAGWLAAQGLADPQAIAVMGHSYGGYAAALAMTRDPGLFAAAVVEMPMTDVEFQSRHHPFFWRKGIGTWTRYFGDPEVPEDLAAMGGYSPVNHVENIAGPVLLTAGLKDQITGHQQARDFAAAARAAGKDVTAHYFENAGHTLGHWRDELARAAGGGFPRPPPRRPQRPVRLYGVDASGIRLMRRASGARPNPECGPQVA